MRDIVVIGSGGHTKTVIDTIVTENKFTISAILCDYGIPGSDMLSYVLSGRVELLLKHNLPKCGIVAIGDSYHREQNVAKIRELYPDFTFISVLHPFTSISTHANIGPGSFIQAGVTVKNTTQIGKHCNINSNVSVGHDVMMEDFTTIGPGCMIGGFVNIGKGTSVNIGSTVRDRINIGEYAVVGMGSVVTKDVPPYTVVYGSPAKVIRERVKTDGFLG